MLRRRSRTNEKYAAAIVKAKQAGGGKSRYVCFKGPKINTTQRAPKHTPYVWMVDEAWASKQENMDIRMEINPPDFTIFNLIIKLEDLDKEELRYLGDDEDDA